ncbi:MAG: methyltransferase domain-containing protein, partial [Planctomycetota bacterium]
LIIRDLRGYLRDSAAADILLRTDLSSTIESVLGDCCGPTSRYNTIRQQVSSYVWDHYGEFDPEPSGDPKPGSMTRVLQAALALQDLSTHAKPFVDLGCGVGRSTFELASRFETPVLGIDLHFPMLRVASGLTRDSRLRYPRRRVGMVYDRREFEVPLTKTELVDFWACDATALPFSVTSFDAAISMNLLDCVNSPMDLLHSISLALAEGGKALIASPYDWSESATAPELWLGGHSQRGDFEGASEPVLRELLNPDSAHRIPGLKLVAETDQPWHVRLHDRSYVSYVSHIVAVEKRLNPS